MNKDLLKVSIRQNAIYLPLIEEEKNQATCNLFASDRRNRKARSIDFDYCNIGCSTSKSGI